MEKDIELRAKISYFDNEINCPVEYNKLLNELYKLVTGKGISENRARELIEKDIAYLVSIKRRV